MNEAQKLERQLLDAAELLRQHGAIVMLKQEVVGCYGTAHVDYSYRASGGKSYEEYVQNHAQLGAAMEARRFCETTEKPVDHWHSELKAELCVIPTKTWHLHLREWEASKGCLHTPSYYSTNLASMVDPSAYHMIVDSPPKLDFLRLR